MGFFSRLKTEVWKVIRGILILGVIVSVVISIVTYSKRIKRPEAVEMIIDADTGNDMDDIFALTFALIDPKIEVIGITSSQYHSHPESGCDSTVYESQRINELLLQLHDTLNTSHPIGSDRPLNMFTKELPLTPASEFILQKTTELEFGEKLNVVTLGAATNLASAILSDSSIADKIRWYGIGFIYNDRDRIWNKNEFNVRNDLDAMDYLLNNASLETYIMPINTGELFVSNQTETFNLLRNRGAKYQYLVGRWNLIKPDQKSVSLPDLSLIMAIMNPDLTTQKDVWTPPENKRRRITVYTWIDQKKMLREFRQMVRADLGDISSDRN